MATLILYESFHHGNTRKVAEVLAEELGADLDNINEAHSLDLAPYDLVGIGSGVFHGSLHPAVLALAQREALAGKKVFLYSTSGTGRIKYHREACRIFSSRGIALVGEFSCRGHDTSGLWKWIGGLAKGHPDRQDLEEAREFARRLREETGL